MQAPAVGLEGLAESPWLSHQVNPHLRKHLLQMSQVGPLYVLTSQSKVALQHRQRAMAHQHSQGVQVHAIAQAPQGKGAPEPVWCAGRDPGLAAETAQHCLQTMLGQRTAFAAVAMTGGPKWVTRPDLPAETQHAHDGRARLAPYPDRALLPTFAQDCG